MNDFYNNMYNLYRGADYEKQLAGLAYWQGIHKRNKDARRPDLYIFSGGMIAAIEKAIRDADQEGGAENV